MYIFRTGFLFYRFDYASAMALGVVVAMAILAVLAMRALSERSAAALAPDEAGRLYRTLPPDHVKAGRRDRVRP